MSDLDRTIHEPIRLRIMCLLAGVDSADFKFLLTALGASTGNLSRANQFLTLRNEPLGASPRFPRESDASACRLIYLP